MIVAGDDVSAVVVLGRDTGQANRIDHIVDHITVVGRGYAVAQGVGFTDQLEKHFSTLSGGQKQLVVVMRARWG